MGRWLVPTTHQRRPRRPVYRVQGLVGSEFLDKEIDCDRGVVGEGKTGEREPEVMRTEKETGQQTRGTRWRMLDEKHARNCSMGFWLPRPTALFIRTMAYLVVDLVARQLGSTAGQADEVAAAVVTDYTPSWDWSLPPINRVSSVTVTNG